MKTYNLRPFPASFTQDGEITPQGGTDTLSHDNIYYLFDDALEDTLSDEYAVVKAAMNASEWMAKSGQKGLRLSLISPFGKAPRSSVLRQERLHLLIRTVKRLCPDCIVGGAVRKKQPEGRLVSACDFLLLDLRSVYTTKEALEKVLMVKSTEGYYPSRPDIFACGSFSLCEEDTLERIIENGAKIIYIDTVPV
ncbi:MAG: hypothetical protein AB9835_13860 [Eubacteriales bacterium]